MRSGARKHRELGPTTRSVEDTLAGARAIRGPDPGDSASVAAPLDYDAGASISGLRRDYVSALDRAAPAFAHPAHRLRQHGAEARWAVPDARWRRSWP